MSVTFYILKCKTLGDILVEANATFLLFKDVGDTVSFGGRDYLITDIFTKTINF